MEIIDFAKSLSSEFAYMPDIKTFLETHDDISQLSIHEFAAQDDFYTNSFFTNSELTNSDNLLAINNVGFDKSILNYVESNQTVGETADAPHISHELNNISFEMGEIIATSGYVGLMEYFKNNPEKKDKITKAAIVVGFLDTFIDKNDHGFALEFELNPLLVASLAYFIAEKVKNSKNPKVQKYATFFSNNLTKAMKVVEYGSYSALTLSTILELSESGVLGDLGGEILHVWEGLGTAADIVEGTVDIFATFGISFALKHLIRFIFKNINEKDLEDLKNLTKKTAAKKILVKLLEENFPVAILVGPYLETKKNSRL